MHRARRPRPSDSSPRKVELGPAGTSTSADPETPLTPTKEPLIVPSKAYLTRGQASNTEPSTDSGEKYQPSVKPEPLTIDHQRHLSSKTDLVEPASPLMVHSIAGQPVDQEYQGQLQRQNRIILVACVITCCLGNLPMGLLALLFLLISYNRYRAGRFLDGMGWSHGALAIAVLGIILAIAVWICFIIWLVTWKFPWNPEDSYYS